VRKDNVIDGCLIDEAYKRSPCWVIHQVNLLGVMGAGVAKRIRQEWPQVYTDYVRTLGLVPRAGGVAMPTRLGDLGITVFNLFCQPTINTNGVNTDYEMLARCLDTLKDRTESYEITHHAAPVVLAPYLMGCGLGGGDWSIVRPMVERKIDVLWVKLPKRRKVQ
jgi:hypothetical protein